MAFDALTSVLNIGSTIIERLIPDKGKQAEAKAQLLTLQVQGDLNALAGQLAVDQAEAGSKSLFVAGWRPFCGWIAGCGLGYQFLLAPIGTWIASLFGQHVVAPSLDLGTLMTLLLGMLGMGAMRSYDKTQGTSNGH